MNATNQRQFCEHCGSPIEVGARFCEGCGNPIGVPPAVATQSRVVTKATQGGKVAGGSRHWGLIIGGLFGGLVLMGGVGWWLVRNTTPAPPQTMDRPLVIPDPGSDMNIPPTPGGERATTSAVAATESQSVADTGSLALAPQEKPGLDEQALTNWLIQQDWFTALRNSLPSGVRANFMVFEAGEPGWEMIEVREFRSFDSGFDPDVSPMIGLFRVSKDRRTTQWQDAVTGEWDSTAAFLTSRGIAATDRRLETSVSNAEQAAPSVKTEVRTPATGSPERQAICDAVRDHIQRFHATEKLPKFLFVVEHLRVSGDAAGFQGHPVNPDGSPMDSAFGDTVFTCLLTQENGAWAVVLDLTRSDVPTPEEVNGLRGSIPAGFPKAVLTDFWREQFFP